MISLFWINVFYAMCLLTACGASIIVMWSKIPTGTSGTVGFTMIALVCAGIATDWLDSNLPWIGVKRSLILWAGILFVIYWLLQRPWANRERRWIRPHHDRLEDEQHEHDDGPHNVG